MKAYNKTKVTYQEFVGKKYAKNIRTYLKNRGANRTLKQCIKLV